MIYFTDWYKINRSVIRIINRDLLLYKATLTSYYYFGNLRLIPLSLELRILPEF